VEGMKKTFTSSQNLMGSVDENLIVRLHM